MFRPLTAFVFHVWPVGQERVSSSGGGSSLKD